MPIYPQQRRPGAPQPAKPQEEDDLTQLARARMAGPAANPPPVGQTMTAQSNGAGSFSGANTAGARGMGQRPNPSPQAMPSAPTTATAPTAPQSPLQNTQGLAPPSPSALGSAMGRAGQLGQIPASAIAKGAVQQDPATAGLSPTDAAAYEAENQQLQADKAKALQQQAAASGIAGMGLDGASVTAQADTGRVQDRNTALTLSQYKSQLGTDEFKQTQRKAALAELEAEENLDLDGDGLVSGRKAGGLVGDGNPDDFDKQPTKPAAPGKENGGRGQAAKGTNQERGSILGFHPGTNDYQVDPKIAAQATQSVNIPFISEYAGSDDNFNYYDNGDGTFTKVAKK